MMKRIVFLLPVVCLLVACSGGAGSKAADAPMQQSSGPFSLTISSPVDLAVTSQPQVNLQGEVNRTAVLTVNDDTYLLQKGAFSEPVDLEEGINAIQIAASDMDGNEVDLILSVTYQP